jgi:hypothetical protein
MLKRKSHDCDKYLYFSDRSKIIIFMTFFVSISVGRGRRESGNDEPQHEMVHEVYAHHFDTVHLQFSCCEFWHFHFSHMGPVRAVSKLVG